MTKVCVYDNPCTMSREVWQDGELLVAYCFDTLFLIDKYPIPSEHFHMGANVGGWRSGHVHFGTIEAIAEAVRERLIQQKVLVDDRAF